MSQMKARLARIRSNTSRSRLVIMIRKYRTKRGIPLHSPEIAMVLAIGTAAYDLFFPLSGWLEENHKYEIAASQESGGGPAGDAAYLLSPWGEPAALAR